MIEEEEASVLIGRDLVGIALGLRTVVRIGGRGTKKGGMTTDVVRHLDETRIAGTMIDVTRGGIGMMSVVIAGMEVIGTVVAGRSFDCSPRPL